MGSQSVKTGLTFTFKGIKTKLLSFLYSPVSQVTLLKHVGRHRFLSSIVISFSVSQSKGGLRIYRTLVQRRNERRQNLAKAWWTES